MKLDREKLLRAREMLGYGVEKTAEEAGVSKNSVLRAEHEGDIRPVTARKIAGALGVRVADLLEEEEPSPKVSSLAPELQTTSPEVREWLKEQGAKLVLMSKAEFQRLVLDMEAGADGGTLPDGIQRLIGEIEDEDRAVAHALMQEFLGGGELFPDVPPGPDEWAQTNARINAGTRLQRALADEYQVLRLALLNYSKRLYLSGRTSNYLGHPKSIEIERQMLDAAFAEEGAA